MPLHLEAWSQFLDTIIQRTVSQEDFYLMLGEKVRDGVL